MNRYLFILFILIGSLCHAEEPFEKSEDLLPRVKKQLEGLRDVSRRTVKRLGNNTIEMEIFSATDGDFDLAKQIFPDFPKYNTWTLKDINRNSSGKDYVLQIRDLTYNPKDSIAELFYELKLPVLKYTGSRTYFIREVKPEKTLVIEVDAVPIKDSFIVASKGRLYVWPTKNQTLWFYFRGHLKLASWILYEALPEQVVLRESGERIQILLQNYQKQETKLYESSAEKRPASVKEK